MGMLRLKSFNNYNFYFFLSQDCFVSELLDRYKNFQRLLFLLSLQRNKGIIFIMKKMPPHKQLVLDAK